MLPPPLVIISSSFFILSSRTKQKNNNSKNCCVFYGTLDKISAASAQRRRLSAIATIFIYFFHISSFFLYIKQVYRLVLPQYLRPVRVEHVAHFMKWAPMRRFPAMRWDISTYSSSTLLSAHCNCLLRQLIAAQFSSHTALADRVGTSWRPKKKQKKQAKLAIWFTNDRRTEGTQLYEIP